MTETVEANPYRDDLAQISKVANHILAQRVAAYPDAVSASRMTQADADRGIRILTAIARIFHAAANIEPIPARSASRVEMFAEMVQIAHRATDRADRARAELYERGQTTRGIALCCQMMLHYLRPWNGNTDAIESMIERNVNLTLEIRADLEASQQRKAA